ncbi:CoA transferase [Candidatus Bathyarchaeota archaeon]|nr:CoA transferase [Candidatus Bathyarchaeota archaeon]MBL7168922.1 CoA transferase [Candidatus Bathyarchaeota archaeon]
MGLLDKIRVLDFSHVYFGPYATMILGDMGADVIKVEPIWGEVARVYPPLFGEVSGVFHYLDRDKRGMTINLKDPKGKEIALALAERSDVIVENFSRGAMDRLGLGYEDIKKVKPDIVYASLSGFGLDGPYAKRPSFASIASAMSGWYRLTGDIVDREGPPIRPAEWHGDLDPALYAVIGILSALLHREWTGEGQLVDVSQLDCMIAQNGVSLTNYLMSGLLPWELNEKYSGLRFFGAFKAKDGWVFIHTSPRMVDRLMEGMGVTKLESVEELEEWVAERNVVEVVEVLSATAVPVAPVYNLDQMMEDPQVKHREMIIELEHPKAGTVRGPNFPVKFSKTPAVVTRPAPLLGQHNEEVLTELLGYRKEEVDELRSSGVIT